jgi:hypothetical protein
MKKVVQFIIILCCFTVTNTFGIVAIDSLKMEDCSQIVLKNGTAILADVLKMTPEEIKYKPCGKPREEAITISKNEILHVKSPNGGIAYRSEESKISSKAAEKGTDGLAIIGFLMSLIFGPIGLVVSIIALSKIDSDPEKFSGKGWAIAGIIISSLYLLLLILILIYFSLAF